MHRFKKKQELKKRLEEYNNKILQESIDQPLNTIPDTPPSLPPASEFRTSLILPQLTKRFSVLRRGENNNNGNDNSSTTIVANVSQKENDLSSTASSTTSSSSTPSSASSIASTTSSSRSLPLFQPSKHIAIKQPSSLNYVSNASSNTEKAIENHDGSGIL